MKLNFSGKFNISKKALSIALTLATIIAPFAPVFAPVNQAFADTAEIGQIVAFNTPGTFTWTAPSNVNSILIKTWGAGGAGGNGIKNENDNSAGQGGGGGGYASGQISITPGSTHTIVVGAGGSSTGGERNGGLSSFGSSVSASGGIGGANWDEIPGNNGGGGNNPQPTVVNTECAFEGTWVYHDEGGSFNGGDENDFAVTCRDSKLTGFCNIGIGKLGGVLSRGFHAGNYICEQGVTPDVGTKCDFDGTWSYNDEGSGNDFAFTCRTGKVTGYCGSNATLPRGVNPGIYSCEYGQPTTTDAPACNFSGTWEYNDDGSGNDFALTCQNNKMTNWCGTTNLNRGFHPGVFSCQTPVNVNTNTDVGGWTKNLDIFDGVNHLISNTVEFFKPAVAYAQTVFNGQGGTGTAGTDLRSGESAASISFVNGLPYASSGGAGYDGGAGGSRGRLGKDGGGDCVGFTCDTARNGSQPGGGGGGSDTGFGGDGGNGYVLIQIMGINFPNPADSDLPTTGHLDSADCNFISGWAYDPNASSTSIDVYLYAGGSINTGGDFLATVRADYPRPDVNTFAGITGDHGFMFPTPDSLKNGGTYQIVAYGVNTDLSHSYNNSELASPAPVYVSGCTNSGGGGGGNINTAPSVPNVTAPSSGVTGVDYAFSVVSNDAQGDYVRYAFDYNNDSIIDYYTDLGISGTPAQITRNFPVGGTHNFHVYAEDNHGNRSAAALITIEISQSPVIPNDAAPQGVLDSASCSVISGWAYDPDESAESIEVHFYADGLADTGTFLGATTANISRPDVNTSEGITGNHGFNFTTPDSLKDGGNHLIVAYGINTNPANPHNNNGLLASIGPISVSGCTLGSGGGNNAPSNLVVTGPLNGSINTSYAFSATAIDADGDNIQYGFDWDNNGAIDGTEEWTPATLSGVSATRSNVWTTPGVKTFQVFARDTNGAQVGTSVNITITGGSSNNSFTVSPLTGLETSESGATAVFTVVLDSAPLADVTFAITSSDTTEGTVSTDSLVFTPSNWNVSQSVTVSGVNDSIVDGTIAYTVQVGPSVSTDVNFNNLPAQNVAISNFDNEVPPTTGGGGGSSSGGGGGGSGYGAGGTCIGFGCASSSGGSGSSSGSGDIMIFVDSPVSNTGSGGSGLPFAQDYCPVDELITVYLRKDVANDPNEVRKLQYFLNNYAGASLAIDGVFGTTTEDAVKAFQLANSEAVLSPWGVTEATGIVYITTTNAINRIFCADNPAYQGNQDLKDILDGNVLENPVDNSGEFDGVIGANATSTNIAGLFGAISKDILNLLKDIPWYAVLITILTLIGTGIIIQSVFKRDVDVKANQMSFIQGLVTLSIASVLNVFNALSFMISPEWFVNALGIGLSMILGLIVLNLIAFLVIGGTIIAVVYKSNKTGTGTSNVNKGVVNFNFASKDSKDLKN